MKQLTPRQGTKTTTINLFQQNMFAKQLTPRQGTKTTARAAGHVGFRRNNSRPVRGRKHQIIGVDRQLRGETTHAPSGDENTALWEARHCAGETTHAPSGDENINAISNVGNRIRNNSRPVRGRKHLLPQNGTIGKLETTHAPSGDENFHSIHSFLYLDETTHAPSGDENRRPQPAALQSA